METSSRVIDTPPIYRVESLGAVSDLSEMATLNSARDCFGACIESWSAGRAVTAPDYVHPGAAAEQVVFITPDRSLNVGDVFAPAQTATAFWSASETLMVFPTVHRMPDR